MGLLAKADPANLEETEVAMPPTAQLAPVVTARTELRLKLLFFDE